jgi:hypothetical protein
VMMSAPCRRRARLISGNRSWMGSAPESTMREGN